MRLYKNVGIQKRLGSVGAGLAGEFLRGRHHARAFRSSGIMSGSRNGPFNQALREAVWLGSPADLCEDARCLAF